MYDILCTNHRPKYHEVSHVTKKSANICDDVGRSPDVVRANVVDVYKPAHKGVQTIRLHRPNSIKQ